MPVMSRAFAAFQAIQSEMQGNPRIVFSQQGSIGAATRADGKSINILDEFGLDRNLARFGQAIDEDWMTNPTIGYALAGAPAIVRLPAMTAIFPIDFISHQAGMWRYLSAGLSSVPFVLWMGGGTRSAGTCPQHALAGYESLYTYLPGVKVVSPHKVYDVKGLMHAAIRDGDPVVFFDYSTEASADIPDEPFVVPIGKAQILKEGTDITIAGLPPASLDVEKAIEELGKAGVKAEYFDPRTLKPFDEETLVKSVTKTKRLLVVSQGYYTNDFSSHMLAVACQEVSGARFRKITFPDAPASASRPQVTWMTPDAPKIVDAAKKLIG